MSIKLLSAAWDLDIGSTEKMVLMCLCDYANDQGGNCWPSVATIARRCSKSERTVQAAIQALKAARYLDITIRVGTSNTFQLDPRKICTPAEIAPPQKTAETPAESAPKPPVTVTSLAKAKPKRAKHSVSEFEVPAWVPAEPWGRYLKMRDGKRAWPEPDTVALLIGKLERWRAQGHDPGAILDNSTMNNWTGIFEPRTPANDRQQRNPPTGTRTAANDAIARLTGTGGHH